MSESVFEPSGVIVLDKPGGVTSHDMVYALRRLYMIKRVGHAGTLDPLATGVLVMLVGRAAKAAEYIGADIKEYEATLLLGLSTDTQDVTGKALTESIDVPSEDEVLRAIERFIGKSSQMPPMYSAKKVGGRKLVDIARRGGEVERSAQEIEIFSICANKINEREYTLRVVCSAGTYIRTLCDDIGKALGCGACMKTLRRLRSGNFTLDRAYKIEELKAMEADVLVSALLPVDELFASFPSVTLEDFFSRLASSGNEIYQKKIGTDYPIGERVRMYDGDGFFALGEVREYEDGSAIKPIKLFRLD